MKNASELKKKKFLLHAKEADCKLLITFVLNPFFLSFFQGPRMGNLFPALFDILGT
jgi:hypothetical protein